VNSEPEYGDGALYCNCRKFRKWVRRWVTGSTTNNVVYGCYQCEGCKKWVEIKWIDGKPKQQILIDSSRVGLDKDGEPRPCPAKPKIRRYPDLSVSDETGLFPS
jgi:hypothetical protein